VVWVVLDTVRPDHVQLDAGAEGNTPNLAALSKGCRVYRQARSDSMWTVPSHASMFSGLDVPGHGMTRPRRLPRKIRTLAQSLGELGYRSTSISANPWISGITDLTRGFDSFTMSDELRRGGRFSLEYLVELAGIPPPLPWLDADRGAALANHLAAGWLQGAANSGEPFFLFVNYMDAHLPYVVPADYRRRQLSEAEVGRSYAMRRSTAGQITDRAMAMDIEGPQSFDARAREILRGQYAAAIGYLDMRVGELARHLRALGVQDDTLLVITSDHGEYLGEHDMWSHRFRAFDAVSRVVLMLCGRGVEPGGIDGPALLSDLHDTVLRAATGATLDPRLAAGGHDLLGAPPATGRLAATRYAEPAPGPSRGGRPVPEALATPEWSFYRDGLTLLHSDDGRVSLFDVRADPSQRHDVSGQQTEALRSMLLLARERLGDASSPQRDAPKDLELPKSTVEALRSLGYTGD
jgi:arylsulfatase A-like enzyme